MNNDPHACFEQSRRPQQQLFVRLEAVCGNCNSNIFWDVTPAR